MSGFTLYYVLSVTGSLPGPWTVTLGATTLALGGTAITPTASSGGVFVFNNLVAPPPSSGGLQVDAANSVGYLLQIIGGMNYAIAYGALATLSSGDQTTVTNQIADMQTRYIKATPTNTIPIYYFSQTFE